MRRLIILICIMLALSAALPVVADGPVVYVVQSGDTLFAIAQRHQTTTDAIVRINNLSDRDQLQVGQKLTIVSQSGGEVGAADSTRAPVGPRRDVQPQRVHIVAPGDTLGQIAESYDTTVEALSRLNGLSDSRLINVGQRLVLPEIVTPTEAGPKSLASGRIVSYTVQEDDTLSSIAFRYGLDTRSVAVVNDLSGSTWLWPGQMLDLPLGWQVKDAPIPALRKRIDVDVSDQFLKAYEGKHVVYSFVISTGLPTHPTRRGQFTIQNKIPKAVSTGLNLDMPYWMGIYYAGSTENGFHALPINRSTKVKLWGGLIGRPVSYGCIVLRDGDAATLYNWAEIGTLVTIHD
jgi:LysM repeat protein